MLDNRLVAILMVLFQMKQVTLYELSVKTGIAKERLLSYLGVIDDLLVSNGFIQVKQSETLYQILPELENRKEEVFALLQTYDVYLTQEERLDIIYLYTFCRQDFISSNHYQDLLHVSRNTTLSDLKKFKEIAEAFGVDLAYTRGRGYHLIGATIDKHRLALYAISHLLKSSLGHWGLSYIMNAWQSNTHIDGLKQRVTESKILGGLWPIEERLEEILYFSDFLALRSRRSQSSLAIDCQTDSAFMRLAKDLLVYLAECHLLDARFVEDYQVYLAQLLQGCFEGGSHQVSPFFQELTEEIVEEMERLSLVYFENRAQLIAGLEKHLIPAYYRLKSRLPSLNSYTETIKKEHAHLFYLVKRALNPLEKCLGFPLPDSEVSYFVIHFGGYLEKSKRAAYRYKALIICPNGVSSSLILKEELRHLFSGIRFLELHHPHEAIDTIDADYDMVFSTIKITTAKPFFLLPTLLSEQYKKELFALVLSQFPGAVYFPMTLDSLLATIQKHATVHNKQGLLYDLLSLVDYHQRERRSILLEELIQSNTFAYTEQKMDWKAAIRLAAQPLLKQGKIESRYIDAMIQKVCEFGPFIDLGKGVAIPHARPEEGVKELGMSLLVLEHPVYLLEQPEHEVSVLICIAAIDNHSHLRALTHLTSILRDHHNITKLKQARTFHQIADLLKED